MEQETQILFKCSGQEKELIKKAAESIGLSISAFCRSASLEKAKSKG